MNITIRSLVSIIIFLSSELFVKADLRFDHLTRREGLPSNRINAIVQDSCGFIWIGTNNGLSKFDGYEFHNYLNQKDDTNSLMHNYVEKLLVDADQHLWIITQNGACIYNPVKDNFFRIVPDQSNEFGSRSNNLSGIAVNSKGKVYMGAQNGMIYIYDCPGFIHSKTIDLKQYAPGIQDMVFDDRDNCWIGCSAGLVKLQRNEEKTIFRADPTSILKKQVESLVFSKSYDTLWLGTYEGGVLFIEMNNMRFNLLNGVSEGKSIQKIYLDKSGNLWILTDLIYRYSPENNLLNIYDEDICDEYGLRGTNFYAILNDVQGNLWIGSDNNGLNKDTKNKNFSIITQSALGKYQLSGREVTDVLLSGDSLLLVSFTTGMDMINFNSGETSRFTYDPQNPYSIGEGHIFDIFKDSRGIIWVGSYKGGLQQFDPVRKVFQSVYLHDPGNPNSIGSNDIRSIDEDQQGNIWVSAHSAGIAKIEFETGTITRYNSENNDLIHDWAYDILVDHENNVWVSLPGGLSKLIPGTSEFVNYLHSETTVGSLSDNNVNCLYLDSKNRVWAGTNAGLNLYLPLDDRFTYYGVTQGMHNDIIQSIEEDQNGELWLGTNEGLTRFNPDSIFFETFFFADGLSSDEFTERSSFRDPEGNLYFGTRDGLTHFHPNDITYNTVPPKIIFTEFSLFNQPVKPNGTKSPLTRHITLTNEITLNYSQNVIGFEFVALNYINSEANEYFYKLEGFEDDWISLGNKRELSFTNLNPGKYKLFIKATNNDGVESEEYASLGILIKPPFWRTVWFYIIVLLLLIMLLYFLIKLREKTLRKDKQRLSLELKENMRKIEKEKEKVAEKDRILKEREESEKEQVWYNEGMVLFSTLLSKYRDNIKLLAKNTLKNLISYLNCQQGAFFYYNDEHEDEPYLELIYAYAYDKKRKKQDKILVGEGLVGTCFKDKTINVIDDLPESYITIESGLGQTPPKNGLLIPVKQNEDVVGVIELLSLSPFKPIHIKLLEQLGENLTSLILTIKAKVQTEQLYAHSISQTKEVKSSEEKLKFALDDLKKVKETLTDQNKELLKQVTELKNNEKQYLKKIEELKGKKKSKK